MYKITHSLQTEGNCILSTHVKLFLYIPLVRYTSHFELINQITLQNNSPINQIMAIT